MCVGPRYNRFTGRDQYQTTVTLYQTLGLHDLPALSHGLFTVQCIRQGAEPTVIHKSQGIVREKSRQQAHGT